MYTCTYIHIYIYIYTHDSNIYIYILRERERERDRLLHALWNRVRGEEFGAIMLEKLGGAPPVGDVRVTAGGCDSVLAGRYAQLEKGKGGRVSRVAVGTDYRYRRMRGSQRAVEKSSPLECGASRVTAESPRLPRWGAPRRGRREGRRISRIVSVRLGGS